jgi:hypothetical protein
MVLFFSLVRGSKRSKTLAQAKSMAIRAITRRLGQAQIQHAMPTSLRPERHGPATTGVPGRHLRPGRHDILQVARPKQRSSFFSRETSDFPLGWLPALPNWQQPWHFRGERQSRRTEMRAVRERAWQSRRSGGTLPSIWKTAGRDVHVLSTEEWGAAAASSPSFASTTSSHDVAVPPD